MDFIATYWWIWLIGMIVCVGYAIYGQVKFMKSILDGTDRGIFVHMLIGLLGAVFMILLLLSVVLHVIDYAKGP